LGGKAKSLPIRTRLGGIKEGVGARMLFDYPPSKGEEEKGETVPHSTSNRENALQGGRDRGPNRSKFVIWSTQNAFV